MLPTRKIAACCLLLWPASLPSQRPPQPSKLTVTSTPAAADIGIDGKQMKQTPFTFYVSAGNHSVSVTSPGLKKCPARQLLVPAGSAVTVNCTEQGWDANPNWRS